MEWKEQLSESENIPMDCIIRRRIGYWQIQGLNQDYLVHGGGKKCDVRTFWRSAVIFEDCGSGSYRGRPNEVKNRPNTLCFVLLNYT